MSVRRITIFDTTLRDGEQSPGIALAPDEKRTFFISPNRQGALFSNHELLQPIFPAEVMADKKAGRKDRPPGWPHPNAKGAGAIADIIIGLEDKKD